MKSAEIKVIVNEVVRMHGRLLFFLFFVKKNIHYPFSLTSLTSSLDTEGQAEISVKLSLAFFYLKRLQFSSNNTESSIM